jgi:hypothetical protein
MGLVALDVAAILSDIFITLIACDMEKEDSGWVDESREGLQIAGLVFSCLFLVELLITIWAFGLE